MKIRTCKKRSVEYIGNAGKTRKQTVVFNRFEGFKSADGTGDISRSVSTARRAKAICIPSNQRWWRRELMLAKDDPSE